MTTFEGQVYDLDFIQALGWCQALIRNQSGNIVVTTMEPRMQTILETAMIMSRNVEVTYDEAEDPKVIHRVKLNIG